METKSTLKPRIRKDEISGTYKEEWNLWEFDTQMTYQNQKSTGHLHD